MSREEVIVLKELMLGRRKYLYLLIDSVRAIPGWKQLVEQSGTAFSAVFDSVRDAIQNLSVRGLIRRTKEGEPELHSVWELTYEGWIRLMEHDCVASGT